MDKDITLNPDDNLTEEQKKAIMDALWEFTRANGIDFPDFDDE